MRKFLLVTALMALATCWLAPAASATDGCYPACVPPTAVASQSTISAKQTETVHGSFWCPGATITIKFDDTIVDIATANMKGAFNGSFKIPMGTSPGTHTITVTGSAFQCTAQGSVSITVNVSDSGTSATSLVLTGANTNTGPPAAGYTFRYADLGIVLCFLAFFLMLTHKKIWRSHPRRSPFHVRLASRSRH